MAVTSAVPLCKVVADILHSTIKDQIRLEFTAMLMKDIEPLLEEYTKQIVMQVAEMRDPYSIDGLKVKVDFKLPEIKT
jgi:hypothetical protein